MSRILLVLAFIASVIAPMGLPDAALAQKRVALVIGNGAYTKVPALPNPTNDAAAVEKLFRAAGFEYVGRADNLKLADLRKAVRDFSAQATGADIAVVFFAGHGIEVNGTNYLIPIDAVLEHDVDVRDEAFLLDRVSEALERAKRLRLIVLDACRDNPFVRSMKRTLVGRSIGRGMAPVELLGSDTLIAYAAKAGYTAADGTGPNSPYTLALLNHLTTPGLDVRLALGRVRDEVLKATSNRQEPWVYGSLGGTEVALVAAQTTETPKKIEPFVPSPLALAAAEWDRLRTKTDIAEIEDFAERHAGTYFADYAKTRINELKKQHAAAAKPELRKQDKGSKPFTERLVSLEETAGPSETNQPSYIPKGYRPMEPLSSAEERAFGPGAYFAECVGCPSMVILPIGEFVMGSPPSEAGRRADEGPQRIVTIAKPFAVGEFEVTFDEWATCVAGGGCAANKNPDDEGWGRGKRPVINVSWDDATQYVGWLSNATGKPYRLLTEAEWEYAARGVTKVSAPHTPFAMGATISTDQANYNGFETYGDGRKGVHRGKTVEVGSFQRNAFGLYDMHGNVWEWVQDCHMSNYAGAPTDGSAVTFTKCPGRVRRGGSLDNIALGLRSAFRSWDNADKRDPSFGFRVARTLSP